MRCLCLSRHVGVADAGVQASHLGVLGQHDCVVLGLGREAVSVLRGAAVDLLACGLLVCAHANHCAKRVWQCQVRLAGRGDGMSRPRLLDLFCGAGGCAVGYHRAGFDVVGIDIVPQPNFPFEFHQADALDYPLDGFDAIHASPPCQAHSTIAKQQRTRRPGTYEHPDLVDAMRQRLIAWGLPYVIENVPGAPLENAVTICGLSVGVNVKRHRLFEANFPIMVPPCGDHSGDWLLVFGHTVLERSKQIDRNTPSGGPRFRRKHVGTDRGREAMGIDWMNRDELSEAIPPPYTELIGYQLLQHIRAVVRDGRA